MSNVQFTNLPAAIAVSSTDIVAIVQNNVSKKATVQQLTSAIQGGVVSTVTGTGSVNGLTLTSTGTSNVTLTLGGSLDAINLESQVTGVLPPENGGTGGILPAANGGTGSDTLPDGGLVGQSAVQTLTNKIIEPRSNSLTSVSPLAWSSDTADIWCLTELSQNLTITADTGSPTNGRKMIFRIKDDGTSRTISWTSGTAKSFRQIGQTLPTATTAGNTLYVGCVYNSDDARWDVVAVTQGA